MIKNEQKHVRNASKGLKTILNDLECAGNVS